MRTRKVPGVGRGPAVCSCVAGQADVRSLTGAASAILRTTSMPLRHDALLL